MYASHDGVLRQRCLFCDVDPDGNLADDLFAPLPSTRPERDAEICRRVALGVMCKDVAKLAGVTGPRVSKIVRAGGRPTPSALARLECQASKALATRRHTA